MRVVRHFAFVDMSGFSALTVSSGDERAVSVLTAFRALLRVWRASIRRLCVLAAALVTPTAPMLSSSTKRAARRGATRLHLALGA